jgi:hypothetical protein
VCCRLGVGQQHGDLLFVTLDECRAPPAVLVRELDGRTVTVHVVFLGREPEGELQRWIAEGAGERLA